MGIQTTWAANKLQEIENAQYQKEWKAEHKQQNKYKQRLDIIAIPKPSVKIKSKHEDEIKRNDVDKLPSNTDKNQKPVPCNADKVMVKTTDLQILLKLLEP